DVAVRRREPPQRPRGRRRDEGAIEQPVAAERRRDGALDAGSLEVDEDSGPTRAHELEGVVERKRVDRNLALGVRDDEARADIELDCVRSRQESRFERRERVLGRAHRRAAMPDDERTIARACEVHVLRATTIAQSSRNSPPANARQSASTAAASACAGSPARSLSDASRRSSPYSSPPDRASTTPSA